MLGNLSSDDERRLADRLRRDGREARPKFSDELHERVCQAVAQSETRPEREQMNFRRFDRRWSLVIAATLLASVSLVIFWLSAAPESSPEMAGPIDADLDAAVISEATSVPAQQLGNFVDSMLTSQQWAYLDHDVRVASRLLMDQLPVDLSMAEHPVEKDG